MPNKLIAHTDGVYVCVTLFRTYNIVKHPGSILICPPLSGVRCTRAVYSLGATQSRHTERVVVVWFPIVGYHRRHMRIEEKIYKMKKKTILFHCNCGARKKGTSEEVYVRFACTPPLVDGLSVFLLKSPNIFSQSKKNFSWTTRAAVSVTRTRQHMYTTKWWRRRDKKKKHEKSVQYKLPECLLWSGRTTTNVDNVI